MSIDELPFQLSLARRKQTGAPGGFETCRSEFRIPCIPTQQNAEVSAVERADSQTHGLNGGLRCNQPREWNEAIRASPKRLRQILARSDKGGTIVKRRARVSWVEALKTAAALSDAGQQCMPTGIKWIDPNVNTRHLLAQVLVEPQFQGRLAGGEEHQVNAKCAILVSAKDRLYILGFSPNIEMRIPAPQQLTHGQSLVLPDLVRAQYVAVNVSVLKNIVVYKPNGPNAGGTKVLGYPRSNCADTNYCHGLILQVLAATAARCKERLVKPVYSQREYLIGAAESEKSCRGHLGRPEPPRC